MLRICNGYAHTGAAAADDIFHTYCRYQRIEFNFTTLKTSVPSVKKDKMQRKCLVNGLSDAVSESIEGALMGNPLLARLGNHNIVVRADIAEVRQKHVTIIGGGGSGHEPSYVGFIGEGMISAGVCGNIFASPSVSAILPAIRTCAGPHGVLLIIKNYTGDRLNFGVALEKARQENINVQMVVVADDVALETDKGITGGRGLAGTLFIHKLAGALAKQGKCLEEIYNYILPISKSLYTMGVALTTCNLPGSVKNTRLDNPNTIEVGLGIHGEGGREQVQLPDTRNNADFVGAILVDNIMKRYEASKESHINEVIIMLNNLGAVPPIELTIVLRKVITYLKVRYNKDTVRVFAGPYMTSLDMAGVSLTVLPVCAGNIKELIDETTLAAAWVRSPEVSTISYNRIEECDSVEIAQIKGGIKCPDAVRIAVAIANEIILAESKLSEYDRICGDGDCGMVMKAGAERVLSVLQASTDTLLVDDSSYFCNTIANAISDSMGGTSGILLEIFFRRMALYFSNPSNRLWADALLDGLDGIKHYGGAQVGMRTMLDALEPAIMQFKKTGDLELSASAAVAGAESTRHLVALAGRANYVGSSEMEGTPDPGAVAAAIAFQTVMNNIKNV